MIQALHIFRKDVRRFRYELCMVGALTGAFAWSHIAADMPGEPQLGRAMLIAHLTTIFLTVAWWFLISQLIHEESLVGDRQFWITRPYARRHLLASKVLFVVVFLNVPLLAAQIAILAGAGYQPLAGLPSLLWMQLAVNVIFLLPPIALATVTRNLAQLVMFILCLLLGVYIFAAASGGLVLGGGAWPTGALASVILTIGAVIIVRWQYYRRLTAASILVGLLTLLLAGLLYMRLPIPVGYALRSWMFRPQGTSTIAVSTSPNAGLGHASGQVSGYVDIVLSTAITGVPGGETGVPEMIQVSFNAPSGAHWSSGWTGAWRTFPLPVVPLPKVAYEHHLFLRRDFYRRIQDTTVALQGAMYLRLQRQSSVMLLPDRAARIPGGGFCEVSSPGSESAIFCSSPYRSPYSSSAAGGTDTDHGAQGIERHSYVQLLSLWRSPWPDLALSPVFTERTAYSPVSPVSFVSEDLRGWVRRDFSANVHMPVVP